MKSIVEKKLTQSNRNSVGLMIDSALVRHSESSKQFFLF